MGDKQEEQDWKQNLKKRLKTNYRLVVMNDDTFEEVQTYHSNFLKIGSFMALGVFVIALLTGIFLLLTPLKHLFLRGEQENIVLESKIQELEKKIGAQQVWTENVRKILVGDVDTLGTGHNELAIGSDSTKILVERSELDEKYRQDLEVEQQENITTASVNLPQSELPLGQRFFSPPISGNISKKFSSSEKHFGVDIIAPKNTAIKAALDGYVISADWNLETGNTIAIQHKDNVITFYKHNSALLKKVGDLVKAGEAIAIIGNTGDHSTGPHLHFELWHKGIPVDPMDFINFN